ncbi:MAG: ABC transporter ATP-binding protein [Elusimicrobia bacterium]|nr:ABC transporter ATP-binding protein [Elusimicrobiota bacterium]MBU2615398.1 ABC transporter ATP-binding protein [Elusimicrobiota bacterium]
MSSAIKIENLTKIYRKSHLGRVTAYVGVKNLSLEVKEGSIYGLIGLNGSGKTTTIKLILGLLFPNGGKISLFGNPMPDRKKLSLVGYLPEMPYFYKFLTGREILNFYAELSGSVPAARIDEVIKIVDMVPNAGKRVSEFSKGMMQRLAIAQSLLHNPPLLVFDEPVSGLDPLAIREMRTLILKLKEEGKTLFFSSHSISEVEKICDTVGILHKGEFIKVVEQKEWQEKNNLEEIFIEAIKDK